MGVAANFITAIEVENTIGEGVCWRASDQTVWWTDIQKCKLYRLDWATGDHVVFNTPERLCSFGFVENDDRMLAAAFESGFAYFTPETGEIMWIYKPRELADGRRLNDGRVAPNGDFWAGSMLETDRNSARAMETGLYRISGQGKVGFQHGGLIISNGLAWSPDANTIYFSDSFTHTIFHGDYDIGSGSVSNITPFVTVQNGEPDGGAVDKEGNYWSATWGGSCLTGFAQDGSLVDRLDLPVPQPSCLAFGGPEMRHIFVTSARDGLTTDALAAAPLSGSLLIYETSIAGAGGFKFTI